MDPGTIAVAMSGGVDSSVAAALLVEAGHRVFGVMLRLWSREDGPTNRCCSPEDMAAARRIASQLGIPFYAIDVQDRFKHNVVDLFIDGYAHGVTPNPCLECNRDVRWTFLLGQALALGATHLATGHYARVIDMGEVYGLQRAMDRRKDQSYVLSVLGQDQLAHAVFPLGKMTKAEVREAARRFGLPVADRPESQDLCFLGGQDYREFLAEYSPPTPGPILDRQGRQLGEHGGLQAYTIGQRKGLGLPAPYPLYVLEKDPRRNAVVVGSRKDLARTEFVAGPAHWVSGTAPAGERRVDVQVRYRSHEVPATVIPEEHGNVRIRTDEPVYDVTPGQAAVVYDGEDCLGMGLIRA